MRRGSISARVPERRRRAETPTSTRSDRERNRRRILRAAGQLVRTPAARLNMEAIARKARLGVVTVYRHFASVEDVFDAYATEVVTELRAFSLSQTGSGRELLAAVSRRWIELVVVHGPALVQMRSHRGFLDRLHAGSRRVVVGRDALARPIREALAELGLTAVDVDAAFWLWNLFFDPREVLDVLRFFAAEPAAAVELLLAAYHGALRAWESSAPAARAGPGGAVQRRAGEPR